MYIYIVLCIFIYCYLYSIIHNIYVILYLLYIIYMSYVIYIFNIICIYIYIYILYYARGKKVKHKHILAGLFCSRFHSNAIFQMIIFDSCKFYSRSFDSFGKGRLLKSTQISGFWWFIFIPF